MTPTIIRGGLYSMVRVDLAGHSTTISMPYDWRIRQERRRGVSGVAFNDLVRDTAARVFAECKGSRRLSPAVRQALEVA